MPGKNFLYASVDFADSQIAASFREHLNDRVSDGAELPSAVRRNSNICARWGLVRLLPDVSRETLEKDEVRV